MCAYFNGQTSSVIKHFNFPLTKFPPPEDKSLAFKGEVWKKLKFMIERESYKCGSPVVVGSGNLPRRSFVCQISNNTSKKIDLPNTQTWTTDRFIFQMMGSVVKEIMAGHYPNKILCKILGPPANSNLQWHGTMMDTTYPSIMVVGVIFTRSILNLT